MEAPEVARAGRISSSQAIDPEQLSIHPASAGPGMSFGRRGLVTATRPPHWTRAPRSVSLKEQATSAEPRGHRFPGGGAWR